MTARRKPAAAKAGPKSPSGYWNVTVNAVTPPIMGEIFTPARPALVSDAVRDEIDRKGFLASAEPHVFPEG